ncbi:hypothetical protein [Rhizobium laguerreae]|uniref:hypothetical protein n=1 Tax=Rhizobium laguerreae TaxID=1076926 RepID=UPI001C920984|nr:hypothetical protein [Rhizobium laguerreae]MBY3220744.1 hypothetical protein [Rhizobium laguerreae]
MNTIHPKQIQAREIFEGAISQLCNMGFAPDNAASFLVLQSMIRIEDRQKRKDAAAMAAREAEDAVD